MLALIFSGVAILLWGVRDYSGAHREMCDDLLHRHKLKGPKDYARKYGH